MSIGVLESGFEQLSRPLLELMQRLTGLETTFVTRIDWDAQKQEVVLALNSSELEVAEGSVVDWSDSMCRWSFLSGKDHTSDVPGDFPGSVGAEGLGMQTFFALPILAGEVTLGTICGASRRAVDLDGGAMENLRLIAQALTFQMAVQLESREHLERAERAEALSLLDVQTGLANRRAFNARLEEELARSGRHGSSVALLVIDIDRFKAVNDTYGHLGGDALLRTLGEVLRHEARTDDVPARFGGDEFALLMPHGTTEGALTAAARISGSFRAATERLGMPCTLSIGISSSETTERREMIAAADRALYCSKANGRDRAEVAEGPR